MCIPQLSETYLIEQVKEMLDEIIKECFKKAQ